MAHRGVAQAAGVAVGQAHLFPAVALFPAFAAAGIGVDTAAAAHMDFAVAAVDTAAVDCPNSVAAVAAHTDFVVAGLVRDGLGHAGQVAL